MTIDTILNGSELTVSLAGRLDTLTAPEFEKALNASLDDVMALVLDFAELEYVSSAGLRVILSAQKKMTARGGTLVVRGVNETVGEIFDVTGFNEILTIE